MQITHLSELPPRSKHDLERADAAISAGFPAVQPIVLQLLEWTKDPNRPVAHPLAKFLASIGVPVVGHVMAVLDGCDGGWTYACINTVIKHMPVEAAQQLIAPLKRVVAEPSADDLVEEVHLAAAEALDAIACADAK